MAREEPPICRTCGTMGARWGRGQDGTLPPPLEFKYNVERFNFYFDL